MATARRAPRSQPLTDLSRFRAHFDMLDPEMGTHIWDVLSDLRTHCPVARSDAHGGFSVLTKHADVWAALHDWDTFSSAAGVVIPDQPDRDRLPPLEVDPP